jgi:hypothetical protein
VRGVGVAQSAYRRYVVEADLSLAFFLSVLSPRATEPNGLINLAYVGGLVLAGSVVALGVGLIRAGRKAGRG